MSTTTTRKCFIETKFQNFTIIKININIEEQFIDKSIFVVFATSLRVLKIKNGGHFSEIDSASATQQREIVTIMFENKPKLFDLCSSEELSP